MNLKQIKDSKGKTVIGRARIPKYKSIEEIPNLRILDHGDYLNKITIENTPEKIKIYVYIEEKASSMEFVYDKRTRYAEGNEWKSGGLYGAGFGVEKGEGTFKSEADAVNYINYFLEEAEDIYNNYYGGNNFKPTNLPYGYTVEQFDNAVDDGGISALDIMYSDWGITPEAALACVVTSNHNDAMTGTKIPEKKGPLFTEISKSPIYFDMEGPFAFCYYTNEDYYLIDTFTGDVYDSDGFEVEISYKEVLKMKRVPDYDTDNYK